MTVLTSFGALLPAGTGPIGCQGPFGESAAAVPGGVPWFHQPAW